MKRFACVWLPTFPIDRMRRANPGSVPRDEPLALVESGSRGIAVTAVNRPAMASGIHAGLMLADARAVLPGLATRPAEAARDARALEQLALWLGRYGPHRNIDGADGLWIDITGAAHLFGGETGLAKDCVGRLRRAGFQAFIAIADTRSGAYALARHGRMTGGMIIAPPGDMRAALAGLPVEGLQLTGDLVILLRRLGLKQIGQLYALPRAALARRFRDATPKVASKRAMMGRRRRRDLVRPAAAYAGWAEALVMRLDQALGLLSEPERGLSEPPVYRVQRMYAEPLISNDGILSALDDLAANLCVTLNDKQEGARALRFAIYRADGTCAQAVVRTSRPACEASHIIELFQPRLERMDAGLGIDAIVVEALQTERRAREQTNFAVAGHNGNDPALLVDRLVNRLGPHAVFYLGPVESHIPERAQRRIPALQGAVRASAESQATKVEAANASNRPSFLLQPAEPIAVIAEVPDGPPARFTWRRVTRRVVRSEGPERIAPEWWRLIGQGGELAGGGGAPANMRAGLAGGGGAPTNMRMRDYYRVEDEHGGMYWIYRAGLYPLSRPSAEPVGETTDHAVAPPAWYLHGLF
jgi:protein ImuB